MGLRNSGETPTPKPISCPAAPSPDAGANCAFASRYPSLRHAGSCQPVRDSLGKRRLLGGKLSATAELCEECTQRLDEHRFCLKYLGCNCVTGANWKADCSQHGPSGTQGFTAPLVHHWTEVCDECTGAATKANWDFLHLISTPSKTMLHDLAIQAVAQPGQGPLALAAER